jgi:CO/xanthine dehydrogenase FAD-binding subunit
VRPAPFDYVAPTSIGDALRLLASEPESRVLAGGQSLVPMLAFRLVRPKLLVDLNRIPELSGLSIDHGVLRINAVTRQADVLASRSSQRHASLLVEALRHVGHPPTRARGTIGGSLSHADPAAELVVALIALDATAITVSQEGERRIKVADFIRGMFETALRPGEILAAIELPRQIGAGAFVEMAPRQGDFAIVSAAVRVQLDDEGRCSACVIVLGGVAEAPVQCVEAAAVLIGVAPDGAALAKAAAALPLERITMDSRIATAAYRRRIAPVLVQRALQVAGDRARAAHS